MDQGEVERKHIVVRSESQTVEENLGDLPWIARGVERRRRLGVRLTEDLMRVGLGKPLLGEKGVDGRSLRVSQNAMRAGRKHVQTSERRVEEYLRGNDEAVDADGGQLVPPAKKLAKWTACRNARSIYSANDYLRRAGLIDTKAEKCLGIRDDDTVAVWSRLRVRERPDEVLRLSWQLKMRRKKFQNRLRRRGKKLPTYRADEDSQEMAQLRQFTLCYHKDFLLLSRDRMLPGESGFDGRRHQFSGVGAALFTCLLDRIGIGHRVRLDLGDIAGAFGCRNEMFQRAAAELRKGGLIRSRQVRHEWEIEIPGDRVQELGSRLVSRNASAAMKADRMGLRFRTSVNCHVLTNQETCAVSASVDASNLASGDGFPIEGRSQDLPPSGAGGESFAFSGKKPEPAIHIPVAAPPSPEDLEFRRILNIVVSHFNVDPEAAEDMDRLKKLIHRHMHSPVNRLTADRLERILSSGDYAFSRKQRESLSYVGNAVRFLSNWPGYCQAERVDRLHDQCRIRGQYLRDYKEYVYHHPEEILGGGGFVGFINVAEAAVDKYRPCGGDLDGGIARLVSAAIGTCDLGKRLAPVVEFDAAAREQLENEFGISFAQAYKTAHDPATYRLCYGFEDCVVEAVANSRRGQDIMAKNARKRFVRDLRYHLSHGNRPPPPGHWRSYQAHDPDRGRIFRREWIEEKSEGKWSLNDLALCHLVALPDRFAMIARQLVPDLDVLEYYSCCRRWGDAFIKGAGLPRYEHVNRMAEARKIVLRAQVYRAVLADYTDEYGNPTTGGHSNYDLSEEELGDHSVTD